MSLSEECRVLTDAQKEQMQVNPDSIHRTLIDRLPLPSLSVRMQVLHAFQGERQMQKMFKEGWESMTTTKRKELITRTKTKLLAEPVWSQVRSGAWQGIAVIGCAPPDQ